MPLDVWEKTYQVNVRGTFLTIKHFLRAARTAQQSLGKELENLAIVMMDTSGQEGHGVYGLVRGVKNEIVRLNSKGRINAVAPALIGKSDDQGETWAEAQATYVTQCLEDNSVLMVQGTVEEHRQTRRCSPCHGLFGLTSRGRTYLRPMPQCRWRRGRPSNLENH